MDELALRVGNLLVGNEESEAGIEVQTFPFHVRLAAPARVAVTGAYSGKSRVSGKRVPPWWSCDVEEGAVVEIAQPEVGARTYLTFSGGLDVPLVLGSRSTHLRNGFGGHNGRALQKGDLIALGRSPSTTTPAMGVVPPVSAPTAGDADGVLTVRAVPAADYEAFPGPMRRALWATEWTITPQSDRTGYRLKGEPALTLADPMELRSYGVIAGIVQVPPSGLPIIQLSDANTAGGYPRIAGVIEADLWRLAQARLGSRIRFVEVDYERGVDAMRPIDDYLASVRRDVAAARRMAWKLRRDATPSRRAG